MLKLTQIFPTLKGNEKSFKLHFAIGYKIRREPLTELLKGKFKEWQEIQNNLNFERDFIFSLIYYKPAQWVFGGVYKRVSVKEIKWYERRAVRYLYSTELLDIHTDLIGRLNIGFDKKFRASYVLLEKYLESMSVKEILPDNITLNQFPGYDYVNISYEELQELVLSQDTSWQTALTNVKGVYLITDAKNGRHYVGSAYGDSAFWSRWVEYAQNGHGGNKELKALLRDQGSDYAGNFRFSILEIRKNSTDDDEIIRRESYWKQVMMSREFGYNRN